VTALIRKLKTEKEPLQLVINGKQQQIDDVLNIEDLLLKLGYEKNSVAVACDGTFVSRSKYSEFQLQNGKELEILVPMQGG
jgi:thiamine biosynthesis protein ThiS